MGQVQSSRLSQGDLGTKLAAAQRRRRADKEEEQGRGAPAPGALPPLGAAAFPGAPFQPHLAGPPLPPCDAERAAYVESLAAWGAPPAAELSNVLSICAGLMRTNAALIVLFGDRRMWIKDAVGYQPGEFPWRASFCGWTLSTAAPQALVVPDTRKDARFAGLEHVRSGQVGFYAGTPLIGSNGHRLGTLCCADPTPRESVDESQCAMLANFAAIVARQLEQGAAIRARAAELSGSGASAASSGVGAPGGGAAPAAAPASVRVLCAVLAPGGGLAVVHADDGAGALLAGGPGLNLVGRPLWSLLSAPDAARRDAEAAAAAGALFALRGLRLAARGEEVDVVFRPISQAGAVPGPHVAVPAFVPDRPEGAPPDATFVVTIHPRAPPAAAAAGVQTSGGGGGRAPESSCGSSAASRGGPLPREPRGSDNGSPPPPRARGGPGSSGGGGGGSIQCLGGVSVAVAEARARCPLPGLKIGAPLASGSYGRVFRGEYQGARVAVKVLEDGAVARRDPATGVSLEAVLSRALRHPGIVATLAWKVVEGEARLPPPDSALIGESIPSPAPRAAAAAAGGAAETAALAGRLAAAGLDEHGAAADGSTCSGAAAAAAASDAGASEPGRGLSGPLGYCRPEGGSLSGPCLNEEAQTWIVLEYCDKGCLQDAVDRGWLRAGRAAASEEPDLLAVLATAREIAAAMAYLHAHDVIHGDLSAYNVLLSSASPSAPAAGRGFAAKVSDFGLARSLDHKSRVQTATYGTITHMAPEVLESGVVSKAADVYSFGVLLWQMCVGSRPWAGMPHAAVVRAVCIEERSLQFGRETDEGVALLAAGCMARDPAERPSFAEVAGILGDALAPLDGGAAAAGGRDAADA